MGSIIEVKKAPVDKQASVIETFETFMALKNVNQCNAIINPAIRNLSITRFGTLTEIF
jgi:hypothetical protein